MDEMIGRTLKGTFEITDRLGEGAMGTVYRAVDRATGRDLAIKIMRPALMREPGMLTRFRREATAMRRVRHPNAVEVVAHGVDQGLVYLAMELVRGVDLAAHLASNGRLDAERAARVVAEVLGALAEAHAHGVVHRDVKPDNVMLGGASGREVKLIDFGVAKPTLSRASHDAETAGDLAALREVQDSIPEDVDLLDCDELTAAGTMIGSPGYMAPEQWSSGGVDGRTDVYACGALLYELLTGRLPFEDTNPFMVAQRQLYEEPIAPHERCHDVPLSLSAIALRALRPRREDRYQSASEMRDALRTFLVERTISGALVLDATLPMDVISPFAAGSLPLAGPSSGDAAPEATRPSPPPGLARSAAPGDDLNRTQVLAVTRLPRPAPARTVTSAAGRPMQVPSFALVGAPASPQPGPVVAVTPLRIALPLAAAFLTLGFVLGLLLLAPNL